MHLLEYEYQPLWRVGDNVLLLSIERIAFLEFLKYSNFDLTCIAVLWYSSNNLNRDFGVCLGVQCFHDLPKCSLTKQPDRTICQRK
jgi:hypothetical protein